MKLNISATCLLLSMLVSGAAFADADDRKWISQCIKDNKGEGATAGVVPEVGLTIRRAHVGIELA